MRYCIFALGLVLCVACFLEDVLYIMEHRKGSRLWEGLMWALGLMTCIGIWLSRGV